MKTIEESVLNSMDCTNREILPCLPYILQDFWEIGSSPGVMINLIKKHQKDIKNIKVLDLGCGKGAVSINISKQINCECYGIDAIPEFISFCNAKAKEYGVDYLCKFEVGDIREKVVTTGKYDVIILGAIGQVFGNYFETLKSLNKNLKDSGIIIIDDGYIEEGSKLKHEQVLSRKEIIEQVRTAGMQLIDEVIAKETENIAAIYDTEFNRLFQRCKELGDKYPEKAEIFNDFINRQKKEYDNLKNEIICSTLVVKKKD